MPMRVVVAVPNDRRIRMARRERIARTATAAMAATAGVVEDRDDPAATVTATMTEVPAAEMASAKSAGADAGETAAAEAATEMTAAEAAGRRQILKPGCSPRQRRWLRE